MSCVKVILLCLTLIIWASGASLAGLSGWLMVRDFEFKGLTGNQLVDIGFMAISGAMFVIGFIGCCGIVFENVCILKLYLGIITLMLLSEIGIGIYVVLQESKLKDFVSKNWNKLNDNTRIKIQQKLNCCGMETGNSNHASYNDSSCFDDSSQRKSNCYSTLKNWFKENIIIFGSASGTLILIQLIIIITSCVFMKQLDEVSRLTKVHPVRHLPPREMHPTGHRRQLAGGLYPSLPPMPVVNIDEYNDTAYVIEKKSSINRNRWAKHDSRHFWKE